MVDLKTDKILLYSAVGILGFISLFIIRSFLIPLIFTLILVHILNPIYKKAKKYVKSHTISSLSIIFFFLLIFIIPISYGIFQLSVEFNSLEDSKVEEGLSKITNFIQDEYGATLDVKAQYQIAVLKFEQIVDSTLTKFPFLIFNLFLIIFFYYYFSREYNHEVQFFKNVFGSRFSIIAKKIKELINGIIYGQIFVRMIQATIATIGFFLIGVPNAIIWGFVTFFAAFLPIIGTGLVWGPLAMTAFFGGNNNLALLILIVGTIVSFIDNLLLPFFISENTNIGPVMTLVSIIGGIELFGLYGILLGPFTLGFFFLLVEEVFSEIRRKNPRLKKIIWTENERKKFRELKTEKARENFIRIINKKYDTNMPKIQF